MPTTQDYQNTVFYALGGAFPGGPASPDPATRQVMPAIQAFIPLVWQEFNEFSDDPTLQAYRTGELCALILMGQIRHRAVSGSLGPWSQQLGELYRNLLPIQQTFAGLAERRRLTLRAGRAPAVAPLVTDRLTVVGRLPPARGPGQPAPYFQRPFGPVEPSDPLLAGYPPAALADAQLPANPFPFGPFFPLGAWPALAPGPSG